MSLRVPYTLLSSTSLTDPATPLNPPTLLSTWWRKASMFMVLQVQLLQPGRKLRTTPSMWGVRSGRRVGSMEDLVV